MRDLYQFFGYMLPVSVARSSSVFTIGRIAYRREGVFPIENALSAKKGRAKYAIYDFLVISVLLAL